MGKKNSTTTSTVSIPPEVLARYNAVNAQADTVSKTPFQAFGSAPSDFVAQMNNQQGAGINRINEAAGSYQPYISGATGATLAGMAPASAGIDNYMSPYIKNVADTTGAMMRQQQEQAQSGALGTAISSGAFGGDRAGIAAANLQQQQQMGYGKTMADIYNQGYTQALGASQADLGRQLQGGAQLAGLGAQTQELGLQGAQAQIAAGTMQQQTEQAGKDAMIKSFMQEKGYPFQVAQFLANIAMGTGALSGSTTTSTQPTGLFGYFKDGGKVNGYAGGGGVSGPRTDSQSGMFEDGYVPPADLPIGQLMVADPPSDQGGGGGLGDIVKIVSSIGGMKNGGVAGGRHGYATDGGVSYPSPSTAFLRDPANRMMAERYGKRPGQMWQEMSDRDRAAAERRLSAQDNTPSGPSSRDEFLDQITAQTGVNPSYDGENQDRPSFIMPSQSDLDLRYSSDRPSAPAANLGTRMIGGTQSPDAPGRPGDFQSRATEMGLEEAAANQPHVELSSSIVEARRRYQEGLNAGRTLPPRPLTGGFVKKPRPLFKEFTRPVPGAYINTSGVVRLYPTQQINTALRARPGDFQSRATEMGLEEAAANLGTRMIGGTQSPDAPGRPGDFQSRATEMGLGEAIASDAMSALGFGPRPADPGMAPIQEVKAFPTASAPDTPTGVSGKPAPIIPLTTQLDFIMHELKKPMYSGYLGNEYRSAGDAAVAFEDIYEGSGGAGNDRAAAYAEDVHAAAQAGDMSGLPPNAVTAYNHFVQNGMTPKQAAGATGRLMVESYAHIDPNARNTLGGGNGTYGAGQWRGSRMEELAEFAGVPLEALTGAPVSTPEGRYYPSSPSPREGGLAAANMPQEPRSGGLAAANMPQEPRSGGLGGNDPLRINKPYKDRNLIGKFFHDPETGRLNPDAIMSLFAGLDAMGRARTVSPLGALFAGLGAGSDTYKGLQKQAADIGFTNAQTASEAVQLFKNSMYYDQSYGQTVVQLQGGGVQTLSEFMRNPAGPSLGGVTANDILRATNGKGFDLTPAQNGVPAGQQPQQPPAAGMPAIPAPVPPVTGGTFPIGSAEQDYIDRARALVQTPPDQRAADLEQTSALRSEANRDVAQASRSFRNANELVTTVSKAASSGEMGALGNAYANIDAIVGAAARSIGLDYDGSAATGRSILNKLSVLGANEMTADQAAARVYLTKKDVFPDIASDPVAAAEVTAEYLTQNMMQYERGEYMNNLYNSQPGPFKTLVGADVLFTERTGNIYQTEKSNISTLLKAVSDVNTEPRVKDAIKAFFEYANSGQLTSPEQAQSFLEQIFDQMPGDTGVSSKLGRYFVR